MISEALHRPVLVFLCVAILALSFVVSDGFFTIDELIYFLGAEAFAKTGFFAVENGYSTFQSEDLRLWFLVDGPNGLVPQYPPGMAVLGAPFVAAFGARGMILMNALAAGAVLWLVYALTVEMYGRKATALTAVLIVALASFFLEYAFGIWPHMISTALVLAAVLLAHRATDPERDGWFLPAAGSGLMIGAAFLFRADAVLILPAIGAIAILYARRPIGVIAAGTLGMMPGLLLGVWANWLKFGVLNPLSYGTKSGGGDDPSSHIPAILLVMLIFAVITAARFTTWTTKMRTPGILGLVAVLGLAAALPMTRGLLVDYGVGFRTLVLDITKISERPPGVEYYEAGVISFWGAAKKALVQSLPWLAALTLLFLKPWGAERRRAHLTVLLAAFFWTLPYVLREWHGGFSLNMRYFLPVVPLLAILAADLWCRLCKEADAPVWLGVIGALCGVLIIQVWNAFVPYTVVSAQQILSYVSFLLITFVLVLATLPSLPQPLMGRIGAGAVAMGFGLAATYGALYDVSVAQHTRSIIKETDREMADIEGPALFYGQAVNYASQFERPDRIIGAPDRISLAIDVGLLTRALAAEYRVFVRLTDAELLMLEEPERFRLTGFSRQVATGDIVEIILNPRDTSQGQRRLTEVRPN